MCITADRFYNGFTFSILHSLLYYNRNILVTYDCRFLYSKLESIAYNLSSIAGEPIQEILSDLLVSYRYCTYDCLLLKCFVVMLFTNLLKSLFIYKIYI